MSRPKKNERLVSITSFIPKDWNEKLKRQASREDRSKSNTIKNAVEVYLKHNGYSTIDNWEVVNGKEKRK